MRNFASQNLRPGAGVELPHIPCPVCGDQMVLRKDGRAVYWHHRILDPDNPCAGAIQMRLGPRVFIPAQVAPKVAPRRMTDPAYARALNNQRDYSGFDNFDDYAKDKFRRNARDNGGALQASLAHIADKE